MPRYFFNMVEGDGNNLVRDCEGTVLSGAREARKEAVGLARDVARHGIDGLTQTWRVVVTDERGDEVLNVPLSQIRTIKLRAWLAMADRLAKLRTAFAPHLLASLVAITTLAVLAIFRDHEDAHPGGYQVAAASSEGAVVAVRFVPTASAAEITAFLDTYQASVVGGPRPGGLFRLRVSDRAMGPDELAAIAARIGRERVIELVAAVP
jgi:hypothetical protein